VSIEDGGGFNASVTILGTGAGLGRSRTTAVKVGEVTNELLRDYLTQLVARVRKQGFAGVIFHLDNMELLARQNAAALKSLFEAVRDVLQEPGCYFIFVGYAGMFQQAVVPLPRVRSIFFDTPVVLEPLSATEVQAVIDRRYRILAVPGKQWIRPVDDAVVAALYTVFSGRIRYVMNAVTSLVSHLPDSFARPLVLDEASTMLKTIVAGDLKRLVQGAEEAVFLVAARMGRFTNSALVDATGKSKQQIQKYLKHWLEMGIVTQAERSGRHQYYEADSRFAVLKSDG
jgi:hypothetical protein